MHVPALLIHPGAIGGLIPLLSLYTAVHAQRSATGNWIMYFGSNKMAIGFNWLNEVQYRNYNLAGDIQQLLLPTGIGYNQSENNDNILLGYGFIRAYSYAGSGEKRVYLNTVSSSSLSPGKTSITFSSSTGTGLKSVFFPTSRRCVSGIFCRSTGQSIRQI